MRVNNASSGRPQYYDRNPLTVSVLGYFNAGLAPAGSTLRASYTVPSNRKANISAVSLSMIRQTVATTPLLAGAGIQRTTDVGDFSANLYNNVVGATDEARSGINLFGFAGNVYNLNTFDNSTGGTIQFDLQAWIYEFDA